MKNWEKTYEEIENANVIIKLENLLKERSKIYDNLKKENVYLVKIKGESNEDELKLNNISIPIIFPI
jgi:hypothetical protein